MRRATLVVGTLAILLATVGPAAAQTPDRPLPEPAPTDAPQREGEADDAESGVTLPDMDRLRVGISMMAAYLNDPATAVLGFEKQGRVGFVIVSLSGRLNDRFRYHIEINPVNETKPLPACGEANFFFPNDPDNAGIGPTVECDPDGRLRVDDYRFLALDPVQQQGPLRQAYLEYDPGGSFRGRFGRFILPIGLSWEETGAFTAKDTPHIARINTEANFGLGLNFKRRDATGRRIASIDVAAFLGDGNKFRDYTYFYWQDGTLDSNSALTSLLSASFSPIEELEIRGAYKFGFTGSKVERLPNFYASKRNDQATVLSAHYMPHKYVTLFGEYARYVWGPTRTSAELLGLDPESVVKPGYYVGGRVSYPVTPDTRVGVSVIREELSRDDALVKYLAAQGLHRAELGKKERAWILRFFVEITDAVSVGFFRNSHSNPLPQLSGIAPVSGDRPFIPRRGGSKYGLAVTFRLR